MFFVIILQVQLIRGGTTFDASKPRSTKAPRNIPDSCWDQSDEKYNSHGGNHDNSWIGFR